MTIGPTTRHIEPLLPAAAAGGTSYTSDFAFSGTGSLSASAKAAVHAAVSLSGHGTLTGAAVAHVHATVALSGTGTLTVDSRRLRRAGVALGGTGTLVGGAVAHVRASVALSGQSSLYAFPLGAVSPAGSVRFRRSGVRGQGHPGRVRPGQAGRGAPAGSGSPVRSGTGTIRPS